MGFESSREWYIWCKANPKKGKQLGLSLNPHQAYLNEWKDWSTFLGNADTSVTVDNHVDYKEAEKIVQKMGFESQDKWYAWCKANP